MLLPRYRPAHRRSGLSLERSRDRDGEQAEVDPVRRAQRPTRSRWLRTHIGMIYSGMGPDYRLLVKQARKIAQNYFLTYREPIPTSQLVQKIATVMQEYTQSGGVRPFGVSLLICGWDEDRPYLFQCDPSGAYFAWKATAMGKNAINGKTFLEKRYSEDLELDDAVHTAILTLKEGFEGQMNADNIEVGICDANGFRRLDPSDVKDYLANIP
ncbi:proteasome subunit alpha type 2 [Culex quinquefasciatus]|uniref:Proteasome subunit alpha type 2 n=1 Tax=Culex quinquefasciatus TaxID=7176 RepID=B0WJV9_CULQU|nr:proteasome subunit alpha type 2 [Culex quinquefasciatus]|eukprot:XP_001848993.1 proteasome subunit alpha type 2 [Culex quinquefasciatus]